MDNTNNEQKLINLGLTAKQIEGRFETIRRNYEGQYEEVQLQARFRVGIIKWVERGVGYKQVYIF